MKEDLKWIKKHYGEKMMHLCREYFPSILETPNLLPSILNEYFDANKTLANDIINEEKEQEFKNFIYSKITKKEELINTNKNPYELMKEASYNLYKIEKVSDFKQFTKYYRNDELLCTFDNAGERLKRCHVFFAIKEDIDNMERFKKPLRQDAYGTSVISLQFSKGDINNVSIKNRYNHTVNNPDATFSNNLDNIIEGLTKSFENEYGYVVSNSLSGSSFELNNYVRGNDEKLYKYNLEIDGIYYCINNVVIKDGEVTKYDKEKYILIENLLIDLVNKKIKNLDLIIKDETIEKLFCNIEYIKIYKDNKNKYINIKNNNESDINTIVINDNNQIISISMPNIKEIGNDFLFHNRKLETINMPNVLTVGNNFLFNNIKLTLINLPNIEKINDFFLFNNTSISNVIMPNLKYIGEYAFYNNNNISSVILPRILTVGDSFLANNRIITNIEMPLVENIGLYFLYKNINLIEINLPNVINIGSCFLFYNVILSNLSLPKVKNIGYYFLMYNNTLQSINLPSVVYIEDGFLFNNKVMDTVYMPNIEYIGNKIFYYNSNLSEYKEFIKKISSIKK